MIKVKKPFLVKWRAVDKRFLSLERNNVVLQVLRKFFEAFFEILIKNLVYLVFNRLVFVEKIIVCSVQNWFFWFFVELFNFWRVFAENSKPVFSIVNQKSNHVAIIVTRNRSCLNVPFFLLFLIKSNVSDDDSRIFRGVFYAVCNAVEIYVWIPNFDHLLIQAQIIASEEFWHRFNLVDNVDFNGLSLF